MDRQFYWLNLCLVCIGLLSFMDAFAFPVVEITRFYREKNATETTFVIESRGQFQYHAFVLEHPDRIVLDFYGIKWHPKFNASDWFGTLVKRIRLGSSEKGKLRLVFDVQGASQIQTRLTKKPIPPFYQLKLSLIPLKKSRLVWEQEKGVESLKRDLEGKITRQAKGWLSGFSRQKPSTLKNATFQRPSNSRQEKAGWRPVIVVIDPGHGGKDSGAVGKLRTREKDVVLLIAQNLKKLLNQEPGFKAVLTRQTDVYLSLRERLALARQYKADIFVSVHADAFKNSEAQGISVYALSQRGATSEAARWLATKENQSELMGGVNLSDKGVLLKSILLDLSQTATISASLKIGEEMILIFKSMSSLHHDGVEQAAFVVLKSPDIPSLLVETGFISNRQEERRLRDSRYREKIAAAMVAGIKRYFIFHPPRGTELVRRLSGQFLS